jgi:sec-independent protein translocase protein TatC
MKLPRRLRPGEEATLVEHLDELRSRIIISLVALIPGFALAFAFHEHLVRWLKRPLPDDQELITIGVTEPFSTAVKVSFYTAVAVALPVLLWQAWSFLAPAFDEKAQRVVARFVVFATTLFAGGVAFSYFVVLPVALEFLTNYDENLYDIQVRASYYLSFTSLMLFVSGVVFQLPIFVLALVRLGVVSSATLRRRRKEIYVGLLAGAILLPTTDPVSLAFEVAPLWILFEASIWLSAFFERRWQAAELAVDSSA